MDDKTDIISERRNSEARALPLAVAITALDRGVELAARPLPYIFGGSLLWVVVASGLHQPGFIAATGPLVALVGHTLHLMFLRMGMTGLTRKLIARYGIARLRMLTGMVADVQKDLGAL